jgi:6-phosphogluconolactonase (cycloisomerase 2 family)
MTTKVRALLVLVVFAATTWLSGCGHYVCHAGFGATVCGSGGGGDKTSGNGSGAAGDALLFIADAGGIQGETLFASSGSITITPNFGTVSVPTNVPGDWMVVAQGKYMYTAYTAIGDIYGWSIAGTGLITPLGGVSPLAASYLLQAGQSGSQYMIANPAGTLLFVADSTGDQVFVYQIGTDGSLTLASSVTMPTGFTPFNLATDGLGKYLFVSDIVGLSTTQVAIYSIGASGALQVLGAPIPLNLQQMQGEASGQFMVGTTAGFSSSDNNVYVMSLAAIQTTGTLTVTSFPTQGTPSSVAVQPNPGGNLVYTFDFPNSGSNGTIEGFQLSSSTGTLAGISGISAIGASGEFDPSGQFLFVIESSNGAASALDAFDVTSTPALATPLANVGWAPGAWQPTDVP